MRLKKFIKGAKRVYYEFEGVEDNEPRRDHKVRDHPPNPELIEAFKGLIPLVCKWMATTKKQWHRLIEVNGIRFRYTQAGTRSVQIFYRLTLPMMGGEAQNGQTPYVRIEQPEDGEDDKPVAEPAHLALVEQALAACVDYTGGAWQPGKMGESGADQEDGKEPKTEQLFDDDAEGPA